MNNIFFEVTNDIDSDTYQDSDKLSQLLCYANSLGIYDMSDFINKFFNSRFRILLEKRDCIVLYGPVNTLWEYFISENTIKSGNEVYSDGVMDWVATVYASIYGMTKMPLSVVIDVLPFDYLVKYYDIGHQMGIDSFIRRINNDLKDYYDKGGTLPVIINGED